MKTQPNDVRSAFVLLSFIAAIGLMAVSCSTPGSGAEESLSDALARIEYPDDLDPALADAYGAIRPMLAYNTCKWLSLPRYAGRYPGTPEYKAACDWIGALFAEWGLEPIGKDGSFLQAYASPYTVIHDAKMSLFVPKEDDADSIEEVVVEPGSGFMPLLYSASGDAEGSVVFAGWGISAPDLGYDDYAGIDVKDKFILCFRGTPDRANKEFDAHDHHRKRMETAKARGALGLIYIYDDVGANPNGDRIEGFLPVAIDFATADRLLAASKIEADPLRQELRGTKKPRSFETRSRVRLKVDAEFVADGEAYNVIGWIEGSDPALKEEFIIIGGHLDHCGLHMGLLFAGANDNASGSACVIEAARAFGRLDGPPKRSVLFALFGGEEMGLVGSQYLADNLPPAVGSVSAMLNLDMEGEGDGTGAVIAPDHPEFRTALEKADKTVGTVRRIREFSGPPGVRGSDYASFYAKGIPCMAFWSNGPHLHYHQPGDTIYRINPDMLADVSRLAFLTVYYLADL